MIRIRRIAKRIGAKARNILRVVLEESGDARVIGEDLGTVPDYVRPVCAR